MNNIQNLEVNYINQITFVDESSLSSLDEKINRTEPKTNENFLIYQNNIKTIWQQTKKMISEKNERKSAAQEGIQRQIEDMLNNKSETNNDTKIEKVNSFRPKSEKPSEEQTVSPSLWQKAKNVGNFILEVGHFFIKSADNSIKSTAEKPDISSEKKLLEVFNKFHFDYTSQMKQFIEESFGNLYQEIEANKNKYSDDPQFVEESEKFLNETKQLKEELSSFIESLNVPAYKLLHATQIRRKFKDYQTNIGVDLKQKENEIEIISSNKNSEAAHQLKLGDLIERIDESIQKTFMQLSLSKCTTYQAAINKNFSVFSLLDQEPFRLFKAETTMDSMEKITIEIHELANQLFSLNSQNDNLYVKNQDVTIIERSLDWLTSKNFNPTTSTSLTEKINTQKIEMMKLLDKLYSLEATRLQERKSILNEMIQTGQEEIAAEEIENLKALLSDIEQVLKEIDIKSLQIKKHLNELNDPNSASWKEYSEVLMMYSKFIANPKEFTDVCLDLLKAVSQWIAVNPCTQGQAIVRNFYLFQTRVTEKDTLEAIHNVLEKEIALNFFLQGFSTNLKTLPDDELPPEIKRILKVSCALKEVATYICPPSGINDAGNTFGSILGMLGNMVDNRIGAALTLMGAATAGVGMALGIRHNRAVDLVSEHIATTMPLADQEFLLGFMKQVQNTHSDMESFNQTQIELGLMRDYINVTQGNAPTFFKGIGHAIKNFYLRVKHAPTLKEKLFRVFGEVVAPAFLFTLGYASVGAALAFSFPVSTPILLFMLLEKGRETSDSSLKNLLLGRTIRRYLDVAYPYTAKIVNAARIERRVRRLLKKHSKDINLQIDRAKLNVDDKIKNGSFDFLMQLNENTPAVLVESIKSSLSAEIEKGLHNDTFSQEAILERCKSNSALQVVLRKSLLENSLEKKKSSLPLKPFLDYTMGTIENTSVMEATKKALIDEALNQLIDSVERNEYDSMLDITPDMKPIKQEKRRQYFIRKLQRYHRLKPAQQEKIIDLLTIPPSCFDKTTHLYRDSYEKAFSALILERGVYDQHLTVKAYPNISKEDGVLIVNTQKAIQKSMTESLNNMNNEELKNSHWNAYISFVKLFAGKQSEEIETALNQQRALIQRDSANAYIEDTIHKIACAHAWSEEKNRSTKNIKHAQPLAVLKSVSFADMALNYQQDKTNAEKIENILNRYRSETTTTQQTLIDTHKHNIVRAITINTKAA